ncbi:MAG: H-type small acid-soluble spore protein [Bacillota bacterium]
MDKEHAKRIAASPVMANVTYNGTPVYIENVEDNGQALIYPLDQPQNKQKVNVNSLVDH